MVNLFMKLEYEKKQTNKQTNKTKIQQKKYFTLIFFNDI